MEAIEQAALASLRGVVATRIEAESGGQWAARRVAASELLAAVNGAWWNVHDQDPSAYERDLRRLNELAGWTGQQAQIAVWRSPLGETMVMHPKFFGGDPRALDEMFVASVSLNHAILEEETFAVELRDQQTREECFSAHRDYFSRHYGYKKFFGPRGRVLHAYATQTGRRPVPTLEDWRALNRNFALYIEAFPTRSRKFQLPPRAPSSATLDLEVFVCALNAIAHDVVRRLLRPRRVLLAGRATWAAWRDPGLVGQGTSVVLREGTKGKCPVFRQQAASSIYGAEVVVVRTNFLRSVYGPNSNEELTRLGSEVLA
jgi:hypothetical protein